MDPALRRFIVAASLWLSFTVFSNDMPFEADTPLPALCDRWGEKDFFKEVDLATVSFCLRTRDPNEKTERGMPVWFYAASHARWEVVEKLLDAGADIKATSDDGNTAIHLAACCNKNAHVFHRFIQQGADANSRSKDGRTLLHFATSNDDTVEPLRYLLTRGTDPNVVDTYGRTPLFIAARSNSNPQAVKLLLQHGADPTIRLDDGSTVLHKAAIGDGQTEVLRTLLATDVDVNALDGEQRTPLHLAVEHSSDVTMISTLLEAGAQRDFPLWSRSKACPSSDFEYTRNRSASISTSHR